MTIVITNLIFKASKSKLNLKDRTMRQGFILRHVTDSMRLFYG